jgi:cytochrome bd-type quinol oxidase subunit 2
VKTGGDKQYRWLEYIAAAAFIFCVLDGIMTVIWVLTEHAEEANSMMDYVLSSHPLLFMVIKMALTALGIALLWRYRRNSLAVVEIFAAFIIYYVIVVSFHLSTAGALIGTL